MIKPAAPFYNVDPVSKMAVSDWIYDAYRDDAGSLCSRFGLTEFCDLGTGAAGDGLFWWDKFGYAIAVSGGRAFRIHSDGTFGEISNADLLIGTPAIFAAGQRVDGEGYLYVANGGKLNGATQTNLLPGQGEAWDLMNSPAPSNVCHVAYLNLRWLASVPDTARAYFTDVNPSTGDIEPTFWGATENPLTADSKGDNISGVFSNGNDFQVWGREGRETWQDGGSSPPITARAGDVCNAGLIAPYSVAEADNTVFALCQVDGKKAVVRLQGNQPVIISESIERVLDLFTTVSDAIGDVVSVDGTSFYILTFPTEGQTWAFNVKNKDWYQWSYWNTDTASRDAFLGRHFIYAEPWGKHLCQSRIDGKIYVVDPNAITDDGRLIKVEWQTGQQGDGTLTTLNALRITLKRGISSDPSAEVYLTVRYRDNGNPAWKTERQISFGKQGEYEIYKTLRALGQFRYRQFSFYITDPAKLILVGINPNPKN